MHYLPIYQQEKYYIINYNYTTLKVLMNILRNLEFEIFEYNMLFVLGYYLFIRQKAMLSSLGMVTLNRWLVIHTIAVHHITVH